MHTVDADDASTFNNFLFLLVFFFNVRLKTVMDGQWKRQRDSYRKIERVDVRVRVEKKKPGKTTDMLYDLPDAPILFENARPLWC